MSKITTLEMECVLSDFFDKRRNLIVPNVSWGMFNYELDLVVLSSSGYATEIEIKISKADLKKDKEKRHEHENVMIKNLYFAIPDHMDIKFALENIPERAGLLVVVENTTRRRNKYSVRGVRSPVSASKPYRWTDEDRYKLARLGALRIWRLKEKIIKLKSGGWHEKYNTF